MASQQTSDSLFLSVSVEKPVCSYGEPCDEVLDYRVRVLPSEGDKRGPKVGHFDVWKFDVATYRDWHHGRALDLYDGHSDEALQLYESLYDLETDKLREDLGDGCCYENLLHFHAAKFKPEFEGSRLMLAAAQRTIQLLGDGCGFVTIWPWDVPFPAMEKLTADQLASYWDQHEEAERYWNGISFTRVPKTPILIRDLTMISPSVGEVLSGKKRLR